MTKKDFELIAAALLRARKFCETDNQRRGTERAALTLADALATTNPKFDRARFLAACGVQS